ncbi:hepatocyte growth factor-regulated tyrosine kinase substrate [Entomortierella parvispora]|uniref:Vacuolar protein sorting-associated protein 27 n=1 Tax=Entomortierella parvispora TaxID=205924 RepID=A0A9P3H3Q7_9FUNG|nr:hepatocyte growth factor-regulated tyrosine kinase substrate [Entomortierella parvispora]
MSSWFSTTSPLDEQIDKATSENLPAGTEDLALNLEICDQIRSKQVSPKDATKALKRRISHKNPNVQLLALGLTDVCVKNGGQHFLIEVASREFTDNLTSILKAPGCNVDVKNRILALLQTWGRLFRGKPGLGYVCDTYMILQHEGFEFPPADNVGAAIVETEAPPDWTDSDVCTRCRTTFTLTNRKHHCRACGSTYCGQCSSKTMSLPHLGVTQEVRVCDGCWMKKKIGGKGTPIHDYGLGGAAEVIHPSRPAQPTSTLATADSSNDDEDLRKAIELSLKEANSQPGYSAPSDRQSSQPAQRSAVPAADEEDADLLAAIEASLKETRISEPAAKASAEQKSSHYQAYTYQQASETPATVRATSDELTATEKDNIELFASLVDKIQMMQGDVAGNREVQALYEQISKLQTKVSLSLEDAAKKQQDAMDFNARIDQAVKMYDHLLQERLNSTYRQRMGANAYGNPGLQQQQYHPGGETAPSFAPVNSLAYSHLPGNEPQYGAYAPTLQQPYQPPQQHYAPYIPEQGYAPAPFASAPPPSSGNTFAEHYQTSVTAPGSIPVPLTSVASPPAQQVGQFPGYAPMTAHAPGFSSGPEQPSTMQAYAPYNDPYQQQPPQQSQPLPHQQQQPPQSAPVPPVEEKPLIEF